MIAIDGSEQNKCAIEEGIKQAKLVGGKVTGICVFNVGSYAIVSREISNQEIKEKVKPVFKYFLECAENAGVEADTIILIGDPANALIESSKDYDMAVCGTLGRTGLTRVVIGSVAEKLVRLAQCPVLICHSKD